MLSILVWLPAIAALVGTIAGGRRTAGTCTLLGSLGALGIAIALIAGFNGNGGQPSMLFGGANSHFGERYSVFSGGSASNDAPLAKKTFTSPQAEIKGAAPSGSSPREFGEKGGAPLTFGDDKKKEVKNAKDNKEARDKEDDAWDIPAFLRRRKK